MRFSSAELKDLAKAWLAISLAFTIVIAGLRFDAAVLVIFFMLALSAGLGFLLHELSHKLVAQHYKAWAEFRADDRMLLIMLLLSPFGVLFAAPGAVVIADNVSHEKHGRIALAGPATNIALALIFGFFAQASTSFFFAYGAQINAWLALFNLIPFGPLDGAKVIAWNRYAWLIAGLASAGVLWWV